MSHHFPLRSTTPQFVTPSGGRTSANALNFPILRGLSLYYLVLNPGAFREPHWHANADEVTYCLAGEALVTIFSNGNQHARFRVRSGEMFFAPSGALHAIENLADTPAEFVVSFSHEAPEDFGLSGFAGCLTPSVLGNTFGLHVDDLAGITQSPRDIVIAQSLGPSRIPESADFPHPYKFPIEARQPLLASESGSVIVARRDTWPALRAQAMFSLRMQGTGMREPHWHPETAELGYVHTGNARMTVQSPGGAAETYELSAGDVYFIPRAYPHHIENLTNSELRFLIFFDTPDVQDIGLSGATPTFPPSVTGPTLGLTQEQSARIPHRPSDLLLVPKINPV